MSSPSGRVRALVAGRRQKQPPMFCIICGSEPKQGGEDSGNYWQLDCNHYHCGECLAVNFNMAIKSKPFSPARCCSLHPIIDTEVFRDGIDPAELKKHLDTYIARIDEYNCKDKLYCHVETCSAFIPMAQRTHRVGTCPKCARRTCKKCRAKSHWSACSAEQLKALEGDKQLLALAKNKNWKQCPNCQTFVEKVDGCPHMLCICGCEFCYQCGRTPFETHSCGRGVMIEAEMIE